MEGPVRCGLVLKDRISFYKLLPRGWAVVTWDDEWRSVLLYSADHQRRLKVDTKLFEGVSTKEEFIEVFNVVEACTGETLTGSWLDFD